VRQLHHLDVHLEARIRRAIVEGDGPVDSVDLRDKAHQFRLRPDDHLARDFPKWLGEPDKLNGIAEAVVAADQHCLVAEILASPYPLLMTFPGVLGRTGMSKFAQAPIA
jgi:hypothetical protein